MVGSSVLVLGTEQESWALEAGPSCLQQCSSLTPSVCFYTASALT